MTAKRPYGSAIGVLLCLPHRGRWIFAAGKKTEGVYALSASLLLGTSPRGRGLSAGGDVVGDGFAHP